jgi:glucans biosynthesis protein C
MRKYFLDNIRWATVLLVLIYHVFYLFNHVGVFGAVSKQTGPQIFDAFLYFVYPWFMVLLFLVAGISARYSLQKRSTRQFLNSRVTKLLVPSTLGLFVYQWISGYLNIKIGGTIETIPLFLRYPIFALSGTGPLWFIQTLFLFSLLIVLIRKLDPGDKLWIFCEKTNIFIIILFVFPIWGASQVLNVPVITVYRFGIYGLAFLAGYFIFSHDNVLNAVEKIHIPAAIVAITLGVLYVIYYFGQDYTSAQCLQSLFTNVYLWIAVLAILGCAKAWFDKTSKFSEYMTRSSFGFYIIHYPVVLVICYQLFYSFNFSVAANYVIAIVVELIFTALLFEIFRKIPVIRYLVLGIKKER